jgi:hypothetical protein
MNRFAKPLSIVFVVLSFFAIRLFVLPGLSFNQSVWDDEIGWIKDSNNRSVGEYISYRDAPGYFVFVPRILILLGNLVPSIDSISSLRLIVFAVQILCFASAAACVVNSRIGWKLFLLVYMCLLVTYVEDLNYLHNVGYLFIFPIFFLVFRRVLEDKPLRLLHVSAAAVLISKPFTAVLIILLVVLFVFHRTRHTAKLIFLGFYCLAYLVAYLFLPNRWETPFNVDLFTVIKLIVNLPWVIFSTVFPVVSIGGLGFIQLLSVELLAWILGLTIYAAIAALLFHFRPLFLERFRTASLLSKSLLVMFLSNYIMVYSASDSYWVKFFPLFLFDAPQFIWTRWSSILPFLSVLYFAALNSLSLRRRFLIVSGIAIQWLILLFSAYSRLKRYW